MNSSSTNYACNEHEDLGQYDQYAIPSQDNAMLYLPCKFGEWKWNPYGVTVFTNSSITKSLISIKILKNKVHMQYHLR